MKDIKLAEAEKYMKRCLELAAMSEGRTAPNPLVGAVLVHNHKIIAEGRHMYYGGAHAEVEAIARVTDKEILKECVLFVNLEPCCHIGKTPPCTQLIIKSGIPSVVIAAQDPSPKVNGQGIKELKRNGIAVTSGILRDEAYILNKAFYTYYEKKRPYILLKWAQTLDGFIDARRKSSDTPPLKISNGLTQIVTHRLRNRCQAIMVGTNTVIMDNPELTNRLWYGRNPLRVTIDRHGQLNDKYEIFNDMARTIVFSDSRQTNYGSNTETLPYGSLDMILDSLHKLKIQSMMVEGGATLINSFIAHNFWDEAIVYTGDFSIGDGVRAPVIKSSVKVSEMLGTNTIDLNPLTLEYRQQTRIN
jgi:diaminohydroxyphosphoribosylaminopyrimidine deaminase/5-amino-6-(5-phosphoribosylamino)uracil reductase